MEPDARYTWVGLATLALVALLAGGLYWLLGGAQNREVKRYTVYFQKQSLEGLQINSQVRMQGVKVGRVTDYAIMPGEAGRVRVQVEVDQRTPVMEGVKAVINRHLVTGLSAIDLKNDGKSQQPYATILVGEEYPVIAEGVPTIAVMASTLEELGDAGQETLHRVNRLLSDRNQKALSGALENLETASGELARTLPEVRGALGEAKETARGLRRAADEGVGVVRLIGARVDALAGEAGATLAQTRKSLAGLDQNLNGLALQLRLSADLGVQEMQTTAQSLRLASDTLQKTGRGLSDPARLIYGPAKGDLGPGEEAP
ncbi:MAG: MCE family protein [Betaproteobacteria bacterium]|nr:MCE family protein [Betaproteobacteria bacterium]